MVRQAVALAAARALMSSPHGLAAAWRAWDSKPDRFPPALPTFSLTFFPPLPCAARFAPRLPLSTSLATASPPKITRIPNAGAEKFGNFPLPRGGFFIHPFAQSQIAGSWGNFLVWFFPLMLLGRDIFATRLVSQLGQKPTLWLARLSPGLVRTSRSETGKLVSAVRWLASPYSYIILEFHASVPGLRVPHIPFQIWLL